MNPHRYELSPLDVRMLHDYGVIVQVEEDQEQVEVELERGREYDEQQRRLRRQRLAARIQTGISAGVVAVCMVMAFYGLMRWTGLL